MKKFALLLCLLAVFAFIVTGCGNDSTVVTEDGTTVTTNEDDGNVTVVAEDESGNTATYTAGENVKLPPNWPQDEMPVYPKSELVYSMAYDAEGEGGLAIALGTDDAMADVTAYYEDQLAGAVNTSTAEMNGIYMLSGEKDGNLYSVVVTSDKESDWTGSKDYLTYAIITIYALE